MKNYILILVAFLTLGFISCKKEEITPGNYGPNQSPDSTNTNWQGGYGNGGVIGGGTTTNNELVGTIWVLTEFKQLGYNSYYPNDTIRFIDNTKYNINNGSVRTYTLATNVASTNKSLTFNYFTPFGGSHYSGQVGGMFVSDSVITNTIFKNIQNTTYNVIADFKRIK